MSPFWSKPSHPNPHLQPSWNPHHGAGSHQVVHAPPLQPQLKEVDSKAKKLFDNHNHKVYQSIHSSLSGEDRERCKQYVTDIQVHRAFLVQVYAHLVVCKGRDQWQMQSFEQCVSLWRSWDSLKQLTHHSKIKYALYNYLRPSQAPPCQRHSNLLQSTAPVLEDDKDGILYQIIRCGRAQEAAFYRLASKQPVHEHGDSAPWKESNVVIDLLHMYLTVFDFNAKVVRERLLSHLLRLSRKSAYIPGSLILQGNRVQTGNMLARGGSGAVVHIGRYNHSDVVIKIISFQDEHTRDQYKKAFSSEATLWSCLQHENIVPFCGVVPYQKPPSIGLVSEFMTNGTLFSYLSRNPSANRRALATDIAKGLEYIHNLKPPVYHGDLKSDNVLVDVQGHARLTDFGRAFASDSRRILDSSAIGRPITPFQYLAPELSTQDENVHCTSYSDMWSFGCVLYEMVTGRLLFQGLPYGRIVTLIKNGDMPQREWTPRPEDSMLWSIIEQCWRMDPTSRYSARKAVSKLS
ncbi:kinase-like domain-containing protein [Scleroderma yunnanense]